MGLLNKNILLFVIIAVISSACSRPIIVQNARANQTGYFQFGAVPERNFYHPISIGDSLELVWTSSTKGSFGPTSITIYDKLVFVPDLSGRVYCFDHETGKLIGVEKNKGSVEIAVIPEKFRIFYVNNEYNETYSTYYYYDYFLPEKVNENVLEGMFTNEMIKLDDGIILLGNSGVMYKINWIGEIQWQRNTGVQSYVSPASSGGKIFFGNQNGEFIVVDSETGEIIYRNKISAGFEGGFTVSGGRVFTGDIEGRVFAIDASNYMIEWEFDTGAKITATPVCSDSKLFIGNLSGAINCINKITGESCWKTTTGGVISTTPILFDDYLLQPDQNKRVHFVDVRDGTIIKSRHFDRRLFMSPVYYDGLIFFGEDQGTLNAFKKAGERK